jgi:hypothetical protein
MPRTLAFAIVGASLAGARAAEELRAQGFDGRVMLIGAEPERPYEHPPLTKDYPQREAEARPAEAGAGSARSCLRPRAELGQQSEQLLRPGAEFRPSEPAGLRSRSGGGARRARSATAGFRGAAVQIRESGLAVMAASAPGGSPSSHLIRRGCAQP